MREMPDMARCHSNGCRLARKIAMASTFSWANARGMQSRSVRTSPTVTGQAAAPRARLQPIKLNVRYANVVNTVRSSRDGGRVSVDGELGDPRSEEHTSELQSL